MLNVTDTNHLLELYRLHRNEFISWASHKYGIGPDDAKDIFQDSIIIYYDNVRSGKLSSLKSSVKTYLFSIGRFKIYHHLAKQGNVVPLDGINGDIPDPMSEIIEEEKEFLDLLKQEMDKLPEKDKEVLTLFYLEKKSHKEIAQLMGYSSEEVARKKKHFSLKKLMELVKKQISILVF